MPKSRRKAIVKSCRRLDGLDADVEVRRHPKARRLTLRVSCTRRAVIVTIPLQCDFDEAGKFVRRNIDWVKARLDNLPDTVPFAVGSAMPLRGAPHVIVSRPEIRSRLVRCESVVSGYRQIVVPGDPALIEKRIARWLVDEARKDLALSVSRYAEELGEKPKRIDVRDQSSRWGSCSTTRVLSFSWRLIMAPPFVLDYVAAHEVAHLSEMNHGPKFWGLVRDMVPELESAKEWLQVYGPDLHRYGAGVSAAA